MPKKTLETVVQENTVALQYLTEKLDELIKSQTKSSGCCKSKKAEPVEVTEIKVEEPESFKGDAKPIDFDAIKLALNKLAKAHGPGSCYQIIQKYSTDGTKDPLDVPPEDYVAMLKTIEGAM